MMPTRKNSELDGLIDSRAQHYFERLTERLQQETSVSLESLNAAQHEQLFRVMGLSPFVAENLIKYPHWIAGFFALFDDSGACQMPHYQDELDSQRQDIVSEDQLHAWLRQSRNKYMTYIAWSDLLNLADITDSLKAISHVADALVANAYLWLYQQLCQEFGTPMTSDDKPMPMLIYGMGKLGGEELNFSSDIDLIFCYPENGETQGGRKPLEHQQFFQRLGQRLITALNKQTVDGFVYRVDMRLRPFGESGPLAMNFNALENYYQAHGRDWERYAMLKARLLPPLNNYHHELNEMLRPFVYRRYIDFSAIESLRRMQEMIAKETRRKGLQDNIKLGSGGIREIEFIAQAFQLIRGGQQRQLQRRGLLDSLAMLEKLAIINSSSYQKLRSAYLLLRKTEHVLQEINDQQTQRLPSTEIDRARVCAVLGFSTWDECYQAIATHMTYVHQEFLALFGEQNDALPEADSPWQAIWDSAGKRGLLADLLEVQGADYQQLAKPLHDFAMECHKRSIGNRGRTQLDNLVPMVLAQLEHNPNRLTVLSRILRLLGKIASRTAYLDLLVENHAVLSQLARLFEASEWVVEYICNYPILLDELIDPQSLYNPLPFSEYRDALRQWMLRIEPDDLEAQMEALRHFKQSQQLRIAAADVTGALPVMQVSDHLTYLAEAIMAALVEQAWQQMTEKYGYPDGMNDENKGFAVVAYGKMGGIELGYGSDLDVVFLHYCDSKKLTSGNKAIESQQFYLKLAQRIMHLCNTRTTSGILYEVDTRLRPQGNSGLLVIHINSFQTYLESKAWTWEHQALVRSRLVYGLRDIESRFIQIRQQILTRPREVASLRQDVSDMRSKMRQQLSKDDELIFDLKQGAGGITDIEFIAQFLVLAWSQVYPEFARWSDNVRIFDDAKRLEILASDDADALIAAYKNLRNTSHRFALQNKAALADAKTFQHEREIVTSIWNKLMTAELI